MKSQIMLTNKIDGSICFVSDMDLALAARSNGSDLSLFQSGNQFWVSEPLFKDAKRNAAMRGMKSMVKTICA